MIDRVNKKLQSPCFEQDRRNLQNQDDHPVGYKSAAVSSTGLIHQFNIKEDRILRTRKQSPINSSGKQSQRESKKMGNEEDSEFISSHIISSEAAPNDIDGLNQIRENHYSNLQMKRVSEKIEQESQDGDEEFEEQTNDI
mmetsp:Transcript_18987/g.32439  ORF Transcript_18987/g.32439 Transcript_18987/m.32439 type:complete len:140 (-) Transcript_18987:761-1180(-)